MSRSQRRAPSARTRRPNPADAWPTEPVTTDDTVVYLERDLDRPSAATLFLDGVPSSYVDLDDPGFLAFEYMQVMSTVIDMLPAGPLRVVHLGAAGCSLARAVDQSRPGSRQIGIDIDARLLELVREWFDLPRKPALRLRADDARHAVSSLGQGRVDVIVRDVFAAGRTPLPLTTAEFAAEVLHTLASGGLYLVNIADRAPLTTVRAELAGLAEALGPAPWDRLALIAEPAVLKARRYGNLVAVAAPHGTVGLDSPHLSRALRSLAVPVRLLTGDELTDFVGHVGARHDQGPHPKDAAPGRDSVPPEGGTQDHNGRTFSACGPLGP